MIGFMKARLISVINSCSDRKGINYSLTRSFWRVRLEARTSVGVFGLLFGRALPTKSSDVFSQSCLNDVEELDLKREIKFTASLS